eukprot:3909811-Rhodomonas_salina.5
MITKSGYKHTRSFKGHRVRCSILLSVGRSCDDAVVWSIRTPEDVINCFVYNEEYLYTASNDGRILQWSLQDEGADKPVKQFGRLLEAYYTEKERKWDFTDSGDEEERITLFKTTPGVRYDVLSVFAAMQCPVLTNRSMHPASKKPTWKSSQRSGKSYSRFIQISRKTTMWLRAERTRRISTRRESAVWRSTGSTPRISLRKIRF